MVFERLVVATAFVENQGLIGMNDVIVGILLFGMLPEHEVVGIEFGLLACRHSKHGSDGRGSGHRQRGRQPR